MKFKNARFVTSAYDPGDFPRNDLPEFAFSGRSNVGKSSMINKLLKQKKLAHTSSTPGRTQCINFYDVEGRLYFVDLPGYGFARVPDEVREEWNELINHYLYNRRNLYGVIQIIDIRHKPTADDRMMVEWLKGTGLPFIVAATKLDKISRTKHQQRYQNLLKQLELKEKDLVLFSAQNGQGRGKLLAFIQRELE